MTAGQTDRDFDLARPRAGHATLEAESAGLRGENAALRADNARLAAEVERLRRALAAATPPPPAPVQLQLPLDEAEASPSLTAAAPLPARIALLRSLFHGRLDAYAAARAQGRLTPAALDAGHRRRGDLLPLDDRAIARHLAGAQPIAIYPLLPDGSCWLLAAELDGASWQADAAAYLAACAAMGVPAALERAGPGDRAHIWTFFAAPVPAARARRLGEAILARAMALRASLSLRLCDRLRPAQDTLTPGDLGAAIALPLQGRAAAAGNALFLDPVTFAPHPDQWRFLSSIRRMSPGALREVVAAAERAAAPDPSRHPPAARARLTLGNLLYIDRAGLPPGLLVRLWRLATMPGPAPAAAAHRGEELDGRLGLPRGLAEPARALLRAHGAAVDEVEARTAGVPLDVALLARLTPPQREAAAALAPHDCGVLCAPPGFGKTAVAAALIAARRTSSLVIVHRQSLVERWRAQMAAFLDLPPRAIGQIGAGRTSVTGQVDIALLQTLLRDGAAAELAGRYGQVIVDECHDVPAAPFERVLHDCTARFVVGLSAAPARRDGLQATIAMQCGPLRHQVALREAAAPGPFARVVLRRATGFRAPSPAAPADIQSWYAALAADPARNAQIVGDAAGLVAEGRTPLVVTERIEHLELLAGLLGQRIDHVVVLRGGMGARRRRAAQEILDGGPPCAVVATGRHVETQGTGAARPDSLLLALPVAWWGTIARYAGRVSCPPAPTREVRIYDYADMGEPALAAMYRRRRRVYRTLGYTVREGGGDGWSGGSSTT